MNAPAAELFRQLRQAVVPSRVRALGEFAEAEIVMPDDSPLRPGLNYAYGAMPFKRLLHAELANPRWRRRFWAGPSQIGGKTLDMIIALCWHLFELGHSCALGGPDVDMIQSVIWEPKIRPVIAASRYQAMLPGRGQGSRGGKFRAVRFANGAHLYFIGGGGSDSQRTSLTIRALFLTELDQLAARSGASIESSPARSMEDRTRAWGSDAYIYGESVIHTTTDLIWQEIESTPDGKPTGSGGRVYVKCPHCVKWVWPSRDNLIGWQSADSEGAAREAAGYACQECGALWSEKDRTRSLAEPRIVHRGQEVDELGRVLGDLPKTETLGVRWNAMHSPMITMSAIAALEWRAANSGLEADERNVCNNVWNEPWQPEAGGGLGVLNVLTANAVRDKVGTHERGQVPADAKFLTLGIDMGEHLCSWMLPAWTEDAGNRLIDCGEIAAAEGSMSPELAIKAALSEFLGTVLNPGWPAAAGGAVTVPGMVLVDSGWWPEVVYAVCREFQARGLRVFPSKGFGSTGRRSPFRSPRETSGEYQVGDNWFMHWQEKAGVWLACVNADHWKRFVHARLQTPSGEPGAMTLWAPGSRMEHMTTAKSLVSEVWEEKFDARRGLVTGWRITSRNNHRLDAMGLAACGAAMLGVRLLPAPERKLPERRRVAAPAKPAKAIRAHY